jgi:hypothetical protein
MLGNSRKRRRKGGKEGKGGRQGKRWGKERNRRETEGGKEE